MPHPTRKLLKPDHWPANHRAALAVLVDLDPAESPWLASSPLANEAGADRLLHMLADLDIHPTAIVDPGADDRFRVPRELRVDPAAHIVEMPADLSGAQARCNERLGAPPAGIVMLGGLATITLEKHDYWFIDGTGSPYPQRTAKGRVVIPYSPWWHDVTWWSTANASPPSALLEAWSLSLASVRSRGELMTILVTAQIAGTPGLVETIQRFLDEAIGAGDVWIANASDIARHVLASPTT